MKSPGGGGKGPGAPKQPMRSPSAPKPAQKPQQKPVQRAPEKPAQRPPVKPAQAPSQKHPQKPERRPPEKPVRKPQRDPGAKNRPSIMNRLMHRQQVQQQAGTTGDISGAGQTASSAPEGTTGGRRRFCCLGCVVPALVVPLVLILMAVL